jgi:hypothetical protein
MGFLKKLLGGDKEEKPPPPRPGATPPPKPPSKPPAEPRPEATVALPPGETASSKQLIRQLGSASAAQREDAARQLAAAKDRSALRPLMNTYLNYGDPAALEALRAYGRDLTPAATREALDISIIGPRRARLMDILGATGDPEALNAVRENVRHPDPDIHTSACAALVRLGDLSGIDELSHDLQLTDPDVRTRALRALQAFDLPAAKRAVDDHRERYLAEAGAVPHQIQISAPRLFDPDASLVRHVAELIRQAPHSLAVVVGSGAIGMATTQRPELEKLLEGQEMHFTTRRMTPEEQIEALASARDAAASDPAARVVVVGMLPSPHDSPPLPHFLVRTGSLAYTAQLIVVDPHEYNLMLDWWHYVTDQAEVPTDVAVVLAVSTPERSSISEEEHLIFQLTPEDQRDDFTRAFLAHL